MELFMLQNYVQITFFSDIKKSKMESKITSFQDKTP